MLERPGCTSASRSWPVPSSYMVLSTRLLRLALGSSPRRAQRGLLAPAPASLLLQNSRFDLGEEQPQLPPLGLNVMHPRQSPTTLACSIPCGPPAPQPTAAPRSPAAGCSLPRERQLSTSCPRVQIAAGLCAGLLRAGFEPWMAMSQQPAW